MIATARTIPLSSSPMINRDEMLEMLEEALNRLPDELRQARWMLKERDEFLTKTRREADDILDAARAQAERMVQRTEVVRAAEQRARQIVEAAETSSPADAPRDRGLRRPAPGQLRDRAGPLMPRRWPPAARSWPSACPPAGRRSREPDDEPSNAAFFDQDRL